MANQDLPRGFTPFGELKRARWYRFDTANAGTQPYTGDPLRKMSNGRVVFAPTTIGSLVGVALSGTTRYVYDDGLPYILVADHPDQEFVIQDDGVTVAGSSSHLGYVFPLVLTAPSSTLKHSKVEMDISIAMATGASGVVQVLGRARPTSDPLSYGSFTKWRVRILKHQWDNSKI